MVYLGSFNFVIHAYFRYMKSKKKHTSLAKTKISLHLCKAVVNKLRGEVDRQHVTHAMNTFS